MQSCLTNATKAQLQIGNVKKILEIKNYYHAFVIGAYLNKS